MAYLAILVLGLQVLSLSLRPACWSSSPNPCILLIEGFIHSLAFDLSSWSSFTEAMQISKYSYVSVYWNFNLMVWRGFVGSFYSYILRLRDLTQEPATSWVLFLCFNWFWINFIMQRIGFLGMSGPMVRSFRSYILLQEIRIDKNDKKPSVNDSLAEKEIINSEWLH